jgi:hypothetical protein
MNPRWIQRKLPCGSPRFGWAGLLILGSLVLPAAAHARNGMTWAKVSHEATYSTDKIGCSGCNPYTGDASCSTSLPIACLKADGSPNPGLATDFYNGWKGGHIHLTPPVLGTQLLGVANADAICQSFFGPGYGMAEFHHPLGAWYWSAFGNVASSSRFWVYINDQPANCWN